MDDLATSRLERERAPPVLLRSPHVAGDGAEDAAIVVGRGQLRVGLEATGDVGEGEIGFVEIQIGRRQVVERGRVVRVGLDRLLVQGERPIHGAAERRVRRRWHVALPAQA